MEWHEWIDQRPFLKGTSRSQHVSPKVSHDKWCFPLRPLYCWISAVWMSFDVFRQKIWKMRTTVLTEWRSLMTMLRFSRVGSLGLWEETFCIDVKDQCRKAPVLKLPSKWWNGALKMGWREGFWHHLTPGLLQGCLWVSWLFDRLAALSSEATVEGPKRRSPKSLVEDLEGTERSEIDLFFHLFCMLIYRTIISNNRWVLVAKKSCVSLNWLKLQETDDL